MHLLHSITSHVILVDYLSVLYYLQEVAGDERLLRHPDGREAVGGQWEAAGREVALDERLG